MCVHLLTGSSSICLHRKLHILYGLERSVSLSSSDGSGSRGGVCCSCKGWLVFFGLRALTCGLTVA